jgi:hypothetical protein
MWIRRVPQIAEIIEKTATNNAILPDSRELAPPVRHVIHNANVLRRPLAVTALCKPENNATTATKFPATDVRRPVPLKRFAGITGSKVLNNVIIPTAVPEKSVQTASAIRWFAATESAREMNNAKRIPIAAAEKFAAAALA